MTTSREFSNLIDKLMQMAPNLIIYDRYMAQRSATDESEQRRMNFINMLNSSDEGRSTMELIPYYRTQRERYRDMFAAVWFVTWVDINWVGTLGNTISQLNASGQELYNMFSVATNPEYARWFEYENDGITESRLQFANAINTLQKGLWKVIVHYSWDPSATTPQGGIPLDHPTCDTLAYQQAYRFSDEYLYALTRRTYVEMYKELNPYYEDLYNRIRTGNSETDIFIRYTLLNSQDFDLIYIPPNVLTTQERWLFESTYQKCKEYFFRTRYNPVYADFNPQPDSRNPEDYTYERVIYYRSFCRLVMLSDVIQMFIMESLTNTKYEPDLMSSVDLNHKLASYELYSSMRDVPDDIKRRVLNNIQRMLQLKGTNDVLTLILSLFAFTDVYLSRYDLVKRTTVTKDLIVQDMLKFMQLPLLNNFQQVAIASKQLDYSQYLDYDEFVSDDPYWKSTKQQILAMPFGSTPTKYISLEVRNRVHDNIFQTQNMMSLMLSPSLAIDWDHDDLKANIGLDSTTQHRIPDILIATMYLFDKVWGGESGILTSSASDRYFMSRYDRIRNVSALVGLTGEQLVSELQSQNLTFEAWEYALKPVLIETCQRVMDNYTLWKSNTLDLSQVLEKNTVDEWNVPFLSVASGITDIPSIGLDYLMRTTYFFNQVLSEWTQDNTLNWRGSKDYYLYHNLPDTDQRRVTRYIQSWQYIGDMRDLREYLLKSQILLQPDGNDTYNTWRSAPAESRVAHEDVVTLDMARRYSTSLLLIPDTAYHYSSYWEYLNDRDPLLARWVDGDHDIEEMKNRIVMLLDGIEAILRSSSDSWNNTLNPINDYFGGVTNPKLGFLMNVIRILVLRFKSYTVTLKDMGHRLILNDKDYCSIRPADQVDSIYTNHKGELLELADQVHEHCRRANLLLRTMPLWWDLYYDNVKRNNGILGSYMNLTDPLQVSDWDGIDRVFQGTQNYIRMAEDENSLSNAIKPYPTNGWQFIQNQNNTRITVGFWTRPNIAANADLTLRPVINVSPGDITAPVSQDGIFTLFVNTDAYYHPQELVNDLGIQDSRFAESTNPGWYLVVVTFYHDANPRVWVNGLEYTRDPEIADRIGWNPPVNQACFVLGGSREILDNQCYVGTITNVFATNRELSQREIQWLVNGRWRFIYERCLPVYVREGSIPIDPASYDFGDVVYTPPDL
jgi:hypothetical protein